jgi:hypothetical protein
MAIAICTFCGGLVLVHSTMCPHCGQRGEATVNRRRVSTFGAKTKLPVPVRRLMIVLAAGSGAILCLAFANWIRPASRDSEAEVASECESIRESGEEVEGELARCQSRLVQMRAQH